MKQTHNSNDPLSQSNPLDVHIKVLFEDDDHGYKDLYLISNTEEIFRKIETCQKNSNQDVSYKEMIYNETINLAFRPKVTFDKVYNSFMNYICCYLKSDCLNNRLLKNSDVIDIVVHINVDYNNRSSMGILPLIPGYEYFDSVFMPSERSKLTLSIRSKLQVLNLMERVFLIRLIDFIIDSGKPSCRWTYSKLLDFFWKQISEEDEDEINNDTLSGIIDTLLFYDFITLKQEDIYEKRIDKKEHYFIFSINDQEIFFELFQMFEKDNAA